METIDLTGTISATVYNCDFQSISAAYLQTHRKTKHFNEGQVNRCKFCSQTFVHSWAIATHIKELHTVKDELFKCKFCDHITSSLKNIARHEKRHFLPEGFEDCKKCNKRIKISNMDRHIIESHQKQYERNRYKTWT